MSLFHAVTLEMKLGRVTKHVVLRLVIDDLGALTLCICDSGDELNEGDVSPCSSVMKGTGSTFIFFTEDLWALLH